MSRHAPWERVREATRRAVERSAAEAAAVAGREGEPPAPGDLFTLPDSGAFGVEWVLLRPHPRRCGHMLAVPADLGALVGSGDLSVPPSTQGGGMVLRCRYAVWLNARGLSGADRSGVLPEEVIEEAARKWTELVAGREAGLESEREIDRDAEYQDWIDEVVAPAHRALLASGRGQDVEGGTALRAVGAGAPNQAEGSPPAAAAAAAADQQAGDALYRRGRASVRLEVAPAADQRAGDSLYRYGRAVTWQEAAAAADQRAGGAARRRRRAGAWLAASVVLAVLAAGLVGYQQLELRELRAAAEHTTGELRRQVEELQAEGEDLQQRLAATDERRAAAEREHAERVARLERRLAAVAAAGSITNPVLVALDPGLTTRGARVVALPPAASHLVFTLSEIGLEGIAGPPAAPGSRRYSMELWGDESGPRVWRAEDLQPNELDEIWAGVPAGLVPPGDYRLRLYLEEDGQRRLVQDFALSIERPAAP